MKNAVLRLTLILLPLLISCSGEEYDQSYTYPGGDNDQSPPVLAWIAIDTPTAGQSFTTLPITVSGRAGMKDSSMPASDSVEILFTYSSKSFSVTGEVTCNPGCILNWETTLDSDDIENSGGEGDRTIRVWFEDAYNSVKINYTARKYQVSGKITNPGATNAISKISIWLDDTLIATPNTYGNFSFEAKAGSYALAPRFGPIPNGCMTFSPEERNLVINGSNVAYQDFTISDVLTCYTVQGHVSADNNPGHYPDYSDDAGVISKVFMYNGDKSKLLTSTWIDFSGNYQFENIPSGSYVLKPAVSTWGTMLGIPMPVSISGHDKNVYVLNYDIWAELYLDF